VVVLGWGAKWKKSAFYAIEGRRLEAITDFGERRPLLELARRGGGSQKQRLLEGGRSCAIEGIDNSLRRKAGKR